MVHMVPVEEDEDDDLYEDPIAIIDELERNKRQPSNFFGNSQQANYVDPLTDDHALVPVDESPLDDFSQTS